MFQSCQVLSKDLAALEAKKITGMENMPRFMAYHRDNVDLDFGNALLREIGTPVRFSKNNENVKDCVSELYMLLFKNLFLEKHRCIDNN